MVAGASDSPGCVRASTFQRPMVPLSTTATITTSATINVAAAASQSAPSPYTNSGRRPRGMDTRVPSCPPAVGVEVTRRLAACRSQSNRRRTRPVPSSRAMSELAASCSPPASRRSRRALRPRATSFATSFGRCCSIRGAATPFSQARRFQSTSEKAAWMAQCRHRKRYAVGEPTLSSARRYCSISAGGHLHPAPS